MSEPFYEEDLAWIHHRCCTDFVQEAGGWILQELERRGIRGGRVTDLGCGTGVWARNLTDRGFEVVGIDASPAMIQLAKEHAPEARLLTGSMFDTDLPEADLVTAIGECINYTSDVERHPEALRALFQGIWESLTPGGLLYMDTRVPGTSREASPHHCKDGEGWMVLSSARGGRGGHSLHRRVVTMREVEGAWRRSVERHTLALLPAKEVAGWLRDIGFKVRVRKGYGDFRPAEDIRVITARKPG